MKRRLTDKQIKELAKKHIKYFGATGTQTTSLRQEIELGIGEMYYEEIDDGEILSKEDIGRIEAVIKKLVLGI
jgi:hypothetical protein